MQKRLDASVHIHAVPMGLFPTLNNLNEVVELGYSKLPEISRNELFSLMMTYQNTLLNELSKKA